jgi:hypothetical protein
VGAVTLIALAAALRCYRCCNRNFKQAGHGAAVSRAAWNKDRKMERLLQYLFHPKYSFYTRPQLECGIPSQPK